MNDKKRRILLCVLDWGLGHATRCIPLIRYLDEIGEEVIVAASGDAADLLRKEFPALTHLLLPAYNIKYSSGQSQVWSMMRQAGKISRIIKEEHKLVEQWANDYSINNVISDNRYGCYSKKVNSIIITHQTGLILPRGWRLFEPITHQWIRRHLSHFNTCWIPDAEEEENLSGKLSHHYSIPVKAKFIGPLTRMNYSGSLSEKYDALAILSGPEPQRSMLERKLLEQFKLFPDKKFVLVAGKINGENSDYSQSHVQYISYAGSVELNELISRSEIIISRSGYSTVMDLYKSNKKVLFIPTPGQTEQEYLAAYLSAKNMCVACTQGKIDLKKSFEQLENVKSFYFDLNTSYKNALEELLQNAAP